MPITNQRSSETQFKVIVVSNKFEGKMLVQRHKEINECLCEEFKIGLHSLSIDAKTPK